MWGVRLVCTSEFGNSSPTRPTPQPGSPSCTAFTPSSSSRQKAEVPSAPANRQAMPTIAIGGSDREASGLRVSGRTVLRRARAVRSAESSGGTPSAGRPADRSLSSLADESRGGLRSCVSVGGGFKPARSPVRSRGRVYCSTRRRTDDNSSYARAMADLNQHSTNTPPPTRICGLFLLFPPAIGEDRELPAACRTACCLLLGRLTGGVEHSAKYEKRRPWRLRHMRSIVISALTAFKATFAARKPHSVPTTRGLHWKQSDVMGPLRCTPPMSES